MQSAYFDTPYDDWFIEENENTVRDSGSFSCSSSKANRRKPALRVTIPRRFIGAEELINRSRVQFLMFPLDLVHRRRKRKHLRRKQPSFPLCSHRRDTARRWGPAARRGPIR